jgi:hypothetical protein
LRDGENILTNHLKKVFWPHIFAASLFQVLDILEYVPPTAGLKQGAVAILNQNPFFEIVCSYAKGYIKKGLSAMIFMALQKNGRFHNFFG